MNVEDSGVMLQMKRELSQAWFGPKSICACGHPGDVSPSAHIKPSGTSKHVNAHAGTIGHGFCTAKGCTCGHFTWHDWTPEFKQALDALEQTPPLCPRHGRNRGDPIAMGAVCNGKSEACS
jgi:hypothetical protein